MPVTLNEKQNVIIPGWFIVKTVASSFTCLRFGRLSQRAGLLAQRDSFIDSTTRTDLTYH